jgi:hypothetical protein
LHFPKLALVVVSLTLVFGCTSTKQPQDSDKETPPPAERELRLKGGAVELKLSDDEKIRAKPKGGGAFFELIIDY